MKGMASAKFVGSKFDESAKFKTGPAPTSPEEKWVASACFRISKVLPMEVPIFRNQESGVRKRNLTSDF
jgi:hypothetical protein